VRLGPGGPGGRAAAGQGRAGRGGVGGEPGLRWIMGMHARPWRGSPRARPPRSGRRGYQTRSWTTSPASADGWTRRLRPAVANARTDAEWARSWRPRRVSGWSTRPWSRRGRPCSTRAPTCARRRECTGYRANRGGRTPFARGASLRVPSLCCSRPGLGRSGRGAGCATAARRLRRPGRDHGSPGQRERVFSLAMVRVCLIHPGPRHPSRTARPG